jgi:hypothetical protein
MSSDGDDGGAGDVGETGPGQLPDATFIIPFHEKPTPDRAWVPIALGLKRVDLTIVMDTTGSMQPSIENLKSNLSSHLLPALQLAVPSIGIALVDQKDFPLNPYGGNGDYAVRIVQTVTTDVAVAQTAVGYYMADGGGDEPEAQISAMWHALTGGALRWKVGEIPQRPVVPGRSGGVDFRAGSLPVIIEITDADWHDVALSPYDDRILLPPSMDDLVAAFLASGAKFIDVTNGASGAPEAQANTLSDRTASNVAPAAFGDRCGGGCCTGIDGAPRAATAPDGRCRLNFLHADGSGVSDSIVQAVRALTVGYVIDVTAVASNASTNAGGVDATKFIRALRAVEEGDAEQGCAAHGAIDADGDGVNETFQSVLLGTRVCFEVLPLQNDVLPATDAPQLFDAWIDVVGTPGSVELDRRLVRFEVPPTARAP